MQFHRICPRRGSLPLLLNWKCRRQPLLDVSSISPAPLAASNFSTRQRNIFFPSCCRVCNTCAEKQSFISRCRICREKLVFYFIYQKNRFLAHVRRCVVGLNFQSTSIYFSLIGTNCISFDSHLSFFKPHYVIYTLPAHFYYYFIICWFFTALLI